eukprot:13551-Heterococcus_DN1.PRE.1
MPARSRKKMYTHIVVRVSFNVRLNSMCFVQAVHERTANAHGGSSYIVVDTVDTHNSQCARST